MRKFAPAFVPAALVVASFAFAAPPPQTPARMHAPAAGTHAQVDTATMHKFANAYEDVMQVRTKYLGKITSAQGPKKKAAIKQQATREMKQRISRYMPVTEYIKVGKEINASTALRKRLMVILRQDRRSAMPASPATGS